MCLSGVGGYFVCVCVCVCVNKTDTEKRICASFCKFENQMKHINPCRWGWGRGESLPTTEEIENLNIYTAIK